MTFQYFNRRLHLYLAMFLMPWFFMYGLSSYPFSHPKVTEALFDDGTSMWIPRFERPYDIDVPAQPDLKQIGARIMRDTGLEGSYGTYRDNPKVVNVYNYTFWKSTRVTYFIDKKLLRAEDRRFRWDQFLTGMHARGGYDHPTFLEKAWAFTVDVICVGFLLWIASGLIMWWQLPSHRGWGWLAIAGGLGLFVVFLVGL